MNELPVGYARVSTEQQDLTAQRNGLRALGVGDDRIYVDHGLTGTNRDWPGLRLALAACRASDTLAGTKLDRLARSLPDVRDILDQLTRRNVKLSLGGSIHDPTDPVGRLLFNVLAMVAEFESDLIRLRTREGMKVAEANGRLRGKQPKLRPNQAKHLLELHDFGNYIQAELAELLGVGRSTIYRTIDKRGPKPVEPERPFATSWCCRSVSQADRHRAELRRCRSQRPARAGYIKGTCRLSRSADGLWFQPSLRRRSIQRDPNDLTAANTHGAGGDVTSLIQDLPSQKPLIDDSDDPEGTAF